MMRAVAVSGYRSLRDVVVPLHGLDVVAGPNGSGKSSLYRSLRLLAGCGRGDVDAGAPARRAQVGTRTPVLADDGADLAAALQIREDGRSALDAAVADAFDGARLEVAVADGRFDVHLHQPGMLRPLSSAELSDGTLRYLLWVAALLTVDPPPLMVLNEPETSLHPDLIPPLARLIRAAAERTQVMVVSHSDLLLRALEPTDEDDVPTGLGSPARTVTLRKDLGESVVAGQGLLTTPPWAWGSRR